MGLQLFTDVLKWTVPETKYLMESVKREFKNPSLHLYVNFHYIYGKKPQTAESSV